MLTRINRIYTINACNVNENVVFSVEDVFCSYFKSHECGDFFTCMYLKKMVDQHILIVSFSHLK